MSFKIRKLRKLMSVICTSIDDHDHRMPYKRKVVASASPTAGGLFGGARMWGAVVNRDGEICGFVTTTGDQTQVWPGSQAIAKAKAYAANAFSLDTLAFQRPNFTTLRNRGIPSGVFGNPIF